MRIAKPSPAREQILEWLEDGNTGSKVEIAEALGISGSSVHQALQVLRRQGTAGVIARRASALSSQRSDVWGTKEIIMPTKKVNVADAIASQPEFVKLWNAGVSA